MYTINLDQSNTILINDIEIHGNIYIGGKLIVNNSIYKERKEFIEQSKNSIIPQVNGDLYINSEIVECTEEFMEDKEFTISRTEMWNHPPNSILFKSELLVLTGKILNFKNIFIFSDDMFFKLMNDKLEKIKTNIKNQ